MEVLGKVEKLKFQFEHRPKLLIKMCLNILSIILIC